MHVCVLGAGIVGLATAWQLNRQGFEVSVIDRAAPGAGASGGNGAQLSYSYVQPLADPSIWKQLPKLLFSPASPLKLRPQLDPLQWRWGLAFLAACNARTSRDTTRACSRLPPRAARLRGHAGRRGARLRFLRHRQAGALRAATPRSRARAGSSNCSGDGQRAAPGHARRMHRDRARAGRLPHADGRRHPHAQRMRGRLPQGLHRARTGAARARRALHARHARCTASTCAAAAWPPCRPAPASSKPTPSSWRWARPRTGWAASWAPTCRSIRSRATASPSTSIRRPAPRRG